MPRWTPFRKTRSDRRGANAVEFALVLPVLVLMLAGTVNWGYFMFQEESVADAYRHGAMVGMMSTPSSPSSGACSNCLSDAEAAAHLDLTAAGITASPTENSSMCTANGTSCAIKMKPTIAFTPLMSVVPMPSTFNVTVVMFAANVTNCATAC